MAEGTEGGTQSSLLQAIFYVADDLAEEWRELGEALELPASVLDTVKYENGDDTSQCLVATVEAWYHRCVSEPLAAFVTALRKLNQDELIDDLHKLTGMIVMVVSLLDRG